MPHSCHISLTECFKAQYSVYLDLKLKSRRTIKWQRKISVTLTSLQPFVYVGYILTPIEGAIYLLTKKLPVKPKLRRLSRAKNFFFFFGCFQISIYGPSDSKRSYNCQFTFFK